MLSRGKDRSPPLRRLQTDWWDTSRGTLEGEAPAEPIHGLAGSVKRLPETSGFY
jgi:hypothetical protein